MSFDPLFAAPSPIPLHALLAIAALAVGALQLLAAKGTARHRALGYLWIAMMAGVAISGFFIHTIRWIGPFSPIHALSALTLWTLVTAIAAALRGNIPLHAKAMRALFFQALILAGAFTLLPGRIMHAVLFGGAGS